VGDEKSVDGLRDLKRIYTSISIYEYMEHGYLVDNSWNCGCGALNAAYLDKCASCEKERN